MNEAEMVSKGWLYTADVVDASIERNASILSAEGIALRRRFVDTVRACSGEGVDDLFSYQEIRRLAEEL